MQFEKAVTSRDLERLRDHFKSDYPHITERYEVEIKFDADGPRQSHTLVGYQLNAPNGSDALLIQLRSFTTVRLAPYEDWKALSARARTNFDRYLKLLGRPIVKRIAARYINRMDIPDSALVGESLGKFFRMGINMPEGVVASMSGFSFKADVIEESTGLSAKIGCRSVPAPIIAHQSFVLDIDVFRSEDIPLKHDDLWREFDRLRDAKNSLFESAITDEMRELFI